MNVRSEGEEWMMTQRSCMPGGWLVLILASVCCVRTARPVIGGPEGTMVRASVHATLAGCYRYRVLRQIGGKWKDVTYGTDTLRLTEAMGTTGSSAASAWYARCMGDAFWMGTA